MKQIVALAVCTLVVCQEDKKISDPVEGSWKIVSLVAGGMEVPESVGVVFIFKDGILATKPSTTNDHRGSYKLDTTRTPPTIELAPTSGPNKGRRIMGIYAITGDELKICIGGFTEADRPKEFASNKGENRILFRYVREKR